jgi:hypothetical protein
MIKFFFDNTFPRPLAEFIKRLAKHEKDSYLVFHLQEKFAPETKDLEFIPVLAEEGEWIYLTGDISQTRNPAERKALEDSGLTRFIFPKGFPELSGWEQSWKTLKLWPAIVESAVKRPSGQVFVVSSAMKIKKS